ncbi:hypothetical protein PJK55_14620 [Exiguobacterium sp. MMG028]|uniref:hypothetical protein n=1 Tax=Exiguobacterium sp. MMG028 TaxID=3021979 RepID=UPI0022FE6BB8|nr:hypothetical protein [Exiguobacterium sp. MMG028]MDA5561970.1 hypothetical protein [Exiguobacterium sp. MMG028]
MDKDERIRKLESAIFTIAEIGLTFVDKNGQLRDYTEKEALRKIREIADPFWEEHLESLMD